MAQKRKRITVPGFQPVANIELSRAMHALASSNAAQPHTPTPHKGTRRARALVAIREQY